MAFVDRYPHSRDDQVEKITTFFDAAREDKELISLEELPDFISDGCKSLFDDQTPTIKCGLPGIQLGHSVAECVRSYLGHFPDLSDTTFIVEHFDDNTDNIAIIPYKGQNALGEDTWLVFHSDAHTQTQLEKPKDTESMPLTVDYASEIAKLTRELRGLVAGKDGKRSELTSDGEITVSRTKTGLFGFGEKQIWETHEVTIPGEAMLIVGMDDTIQEIPKGFRNKKGTLRARVVEYCQAVSATTACRVSLIKYPDGIYVIAAYPTEKAGIFGRKEKVADTPCTPELLFIPINAEGAAQIHGELIANYRALLSDPLQQKKLAEKKVHFALTRILKEYKIDGTGYQQLKSILESKFPKLTGDNLESVWGIPNFVVSTMEKHERVEVEGKLSVGIEKVIESALRVAFTETELIPQFEQIIDPKRASKNGQERFGKDLRFAVPFFSWAKERLDVLKQDDSPLDQQLTTFVFDLYFLSKKLEEHIQGYSDHNGTYMQALKIRGGERKSELRFDPETLSSFFPQIIIEVRQEMIMNSMYSLTMSEPDYEQFLENLPETYHQKVKNRLRDAARSLEIQEALSQKLLTELEDHYQQENGDSKINLWKSLHRVLQSVLAQISEIRESYPLAQEFFPNLSLTEKEEETLPILVYEPTA